MRSKKTVLWLRKFNPGGSEYNTSVFLQFSGGFCTITLQDKSFPLSLVEFLLTRPLSVLAAGIAFPAGIALMLFLLYIILPKSAEPSVWFLIPFLLIYAVIFRKALIHFVSKLHPIRISTASELQSIKVLSKNIREHGTLPFPKVFACADAQWKPLVIEMLNNVDVILLDLSSVSENMRWETTAALSSKPADKIVILVRTGIDSDWDRAKLAAKLFDSNTESLILEKFRNVKIIKYQEIMNNKNNRNNIDRVKVKSITFAISSAISEAIAK